MRWMPLHFDDATKHGLTFKSLSRHGSHRTDGVKFDEVGLVVDNRLAPATLS